MKATVAGKMNTLQVLLDACVDRLGQDLPLAPPVNPGAAAALHWDDDAGFDQGPMLAHADAGAPIAEVDEQAASEAVGELRIFGCPSSYSPEQ
ncbi:hypothetical protein D3C86_1881500 [compost metagenome]